MKRFENSKRKKWYLRVSPGTPVSLACSHRTNCFTFISYPALRPYIRRVAKENICSTFLFWPRGPHESGQSKTCRPFTPLPPTYSPLPEQIFRTLLAPSSSQTVSGIKPIWGPRPDFYYYLLMWSALSDKMGLLFTVAVGPRQLSYSRVRLPQDS
jgi:hypothetical protein